MQQEPTSRGRLSAAGLRPDAGAELTAKPTPAPRAAGRERTADAPYGAFTVKMAVQIAAPHTWPAAILPCLVAVACAAVTSPAVSVTLSFALLAICILMQASVNTFNDYYDYVKGTDEADADVAVDDAVLVYNNVDPKSALRLAVGFLVAAFAIGGYVIWCAGWIPLAIGIVGAVFVVAYSAGKTPLSYLPVGEVVSGVVMGGLICVACYQALTGTLRAESALWALPTTLGVGLIMLTNNTCDIERDVEANRRTLPTKLGRARARSLYHAVLWTWIALVFANVAVFFTAGLPVLVFMLLACIPLLKPLLANPLAGNTRQAAMGQICTVNVALGAFYAAAVFASGSATFVL